MENNELKEELKMLIDLRSIKLIELEHITEQHLSPIDYQELCDHISIINVHINNTLDIINTKLLSNGDKK